MYIKEFYQRVETSLKRNRVNIYKGRHKRHVQYVYWNSGVYTKVGGICVSSDTSPSSFHFPNIFCQLSIFVRWKCTSISLKLFFCSNICLNRFSNIFNSLIRRYASFWSFRGSRAACCSISPILLRRFVEFSINWSSERKILIALSSWKRRKYMFDISHNSLSKFIERNLLSDQKWWNRLNFAVSTTVLKADIPFNGNSLPAQTIRFEVKWSLWVWCCQFGFIWNVALFIVDAMHGLWKANYFSTIISKCPELVFKLSLFTLQSYVKLWQPKHSPKKAILLRDW